MQWLLGAAILVMGISFVVSGSARRSSQLRSAGIVITIAGALIIALEVGAAIASRR